MSLKHVVHKRVHLERPQPAARRKLGYLEKHKDYVKRAQNFHEKEDQIKTLHRKAYFKNPDEFNIGMLDVKRDEKDGRVYKKPKHLTEDELKLIDTQDAKYIIMREQMDKKFVQRAMESLHFLDANKPNKHTIFVDEDDMAAAGGASSSSAGKSKRKLKDFNLAAHLDTHPALLDQKANRPRLRQLEVANFADREEAMEQAKESYQELLHRQERARMLGRVREELELRQHLREKGIKKKVGETPDGRPIYKWNPERKK